MQFTNAAQALEFITAGNATVTIVSKKTAARFTYRVRRPEGKDISFVSLLTGSDNEGDFSYLGIITAEGLFRMTAKSCATTDAPSAIAFIWTWNLLDDGFLSDNVEIWHEGKCGRCGRKLTVPASIESGIGPECAKVMAGV